MRWIIIFYVSSALGHGPAIKDGYPNELACRLALEAAQLHNTSELMAIMCAPASCLQER
jgi:hypothetical protein